jgi:hypothetical protein
MAIVNFTDADFQALQNRITVLENRMGFARRLLRFIVTILRGEYSVDKSLITGADLDVYQAEDGASGTVRIGVGRPPDPYAPP